MRDASLDRVADSDPTDLTDDLPEQVRVRREKYDRLVEAGTPPYDLGFPRTASLAEIREEYADLASDSASGETAGVAGRVVLYRTGGKLCFATIQEGDTQLQVMVSLDGVGPERLAAWETGGDPRARGGGAGGG